ncbi:MAG: tRNA (adenosine(37)-N6)-threonylcarbamoyltransferase complex ATPase subunit type 1 TsaE [Candidatus Aadella gelida]|nr:tRNA (adenosine(37)-N6)-threonylcarbamoyltransferase complex ATPase subunit type 1 TsaE [Candidatus Aadella gelida]
MGSSIYKEIITNSPEETVELGNEIAKKLAKGDLVALCGDLGAGKTMFVKGLAKGLGVEDYLHVNSPSFVILKEYSGRMRLYHFDVYRLQEESFAQTLDYRQYFYGNGITVVEWANKIEELLPDEYVRIEAEHIGPEKRKFTIKKCGVSDVNENSSI